jgi:integrase
MSVTQAKLEFRNWLSKVETRLTNIRAYQRRTGSHLLTPQDAEELTGEWYRWFTEKQLQEDHGAEYWRDEGCYLQDRYRDAVAKANGGQWRADINPSDVWELAEARETIRPVVADHAQTAQFLHSRSLRLEPVSSDMFLDRVGRELVDHVISLLVRRSGGDWRHDKHAERFPHSLGNDPTLTPVKLFETWCERRTKKPKAGTIARFRVVFEDLQREFPHGVDKIDRKAAQAWIISRITADRSDKTVRTVWLCACKAVFSWAVVEDKLTANVFDAVNVSVAKRPKGRKTFTAEEAVLILGEAFGTPVPSIGSSGAARRWLPWLCAYTGAHAGEIAQLRGVDVVNQGGIWTIKITPEAGTVKTDDARVVPLHEDLLDQGFLTFAQGSDGGPLFYQIVAHGLNGLVRRPRPWTRTEPYARVVRRMGDWVHSLVPNLPESVRPNHAWRHTFKMLGRGAGLSDDMLDFICGHGPASVGRDYGPPELRDMAKALKEFPRFEIGSSAERSGCGERRDGGWWSRRITQERKPVRNSPVSLTRSVVTQKGP